MFDILRGKMVDNQIVARRVRDRNVINAFRKVPRHIFVPRELWSHAYDDCPLPIGFGQTISQPYMNAYIFDALNLKKHDRVLEVGSGSGYVCALLSEIVVDVDGVDIVDGVDMIGVDVVGVERVPELVFRSRKVLKKLGSTNIEIIEGDGTKHLNKGLFDVIIVSAAAQTVPSVLFDQLSDNGRLIIPLETGHAWQDLWLIEKQGDKIVEKRLCEVRFVPLVGEF